MQKHFITTQKKDKIMERNFEDKLSMFEKVYTLLAARAAETNSVPAVATQLTAFKAKLGEIFASAGAAGADITGYTVQKQDQRSKLQEAIYVMSSAYVALQAMNNAPQHVEKANYTISMLDRMRDNDLYTYANQIIAYTTPIIASLAPFGAAPAQLAALNTETQAFFDLIQNPRFKIAERAAENEHLAKLFGEADSLLKDKLDRLLDVFVVSNNKLHTAYKYARGIDGTGTPSSPDYSGTVPPTEFAIIATIGFSASRTFTVRNTGKVPFTFALSTTANAEGQALVVQPGATADRRSSNLNQRGDNLVIVNSDTTTDAEYEIRITE
ncbi:MAG: hypothetical protein RL660_547 [Bacteroidota bacterium]